MEYRKKYIKCETNINSDDSLQGDSSGISSYVLDEELELVINMALATSRPLFVHGKSGCGKTQLAKYVAMTMPKNMWRYLSITVDSRTESSDFLYRFDALARLKQANSKDSPRLKETSEYDEPGILWWAYDSQSAWAQHCRCHDIEKSPLTDGRTDDPSKTSQEIKYIADWHDKQIQGDEDVNLIISLISSAYWYNNASGSSHIVNKEVFNSLYAPYNLTDTTTESFEKNKSQLIEYFNTSRSLFDKLLPAVVLIDELDKADPDLPSSLLVPLGSRRFSTKNRREDIHVKNCENYKESDKDHTCGPLIIIASNNIERFSHAFLRRCFCYEISEPEKEKLQKISERRGWSTKRSDKLIETLFSEKVLKDDKVWDRSTAHFIDIYKTIEAFMEEDSDGEFNNKLNDITSFLERIHSENNEETYDAFSNMHYDTAND